MCRKKKIKCDGKLPECTHCANYHTQCVFTQVEKKRSTPKGYDLLVSTAIEVLTFLQSEIYRSIRKQINENGNLAEAWWYVYKRSAYATVC
jgi:hypothetical protein